jgi:hypothetical protein
MISSGSSMNAGIVVKHVENVGIDIFEIVCRGCMELRTRGY